MNYLFIKNMKFTNHLEYEYVLITQAGEDGYPKSRKIQI